MDTGSNEHVEVYKGKRVLDVLHNLKAQGVVVPGKTLCTLTTKEVVGTSFVILITEVLYTIACNGQLYSSQNNQFTTATFNGETGWTVG